MPANKSSFQDALRKASNAAWDRRWNTAIIEYQRALLEFPNDASAHAGLALALQESGNLDQALAEYKFLAKLQAGDPAPLAHVAVLLERMNQKRQAANAYLDLAEVYCQEKQMTRAVEAWRKAVALDPDMVAPHSKLAAAFLEAGHNAAAAREFVTLAKLAQRNGEGNKAQEYVERALALEPDNTQARFLINELNGRGASLAAQPGASPVELARRSALSRLASTVLDDKTPWRRSESLALGAADVDAMLARAINAQENGQTREAIQLYEEIIASGIERPEVLFNLAILYQNTLRYDDSIRLLNQTAPLPQFAVASQFALGQSYRAQGKVDEALGHYIQAMKIVDLSTVNRAQADQVIRLYQSLSEGYRAKGDEQSARQFSETLIAFLAAKGWQDKVRQVRDHIDAVAAEGTPLSMQEVFEAPESQRVIELIHTSQSLRAAGKLNAASDLIYQAVELAPNYLPAHVQLAEISVAAGRIPQAIDKYDMLAETAEVRRDPGKAISFYRQALKLGSDDVTRRAKLISVLVQNGKLTEALDEYVTVGQALETAGALQKAADKYAEGLGLAERAGVVGETVDTLRRQLGTTYLKLREYDKALSVYQQIQQSDPDDDHARYFLIELYYRMGQTRLAEARLDELLDRSADAPEYARATLESLADAFPNEVGAHRRLAQTYAASGDRERAIATLDALGERLLQAGKREQAVLVIQDIITLDPPQVNEYRSLMLDLRGETPQTTPVA